MILRRSAGLTALLLLVLTLAGKVQSQILPPFDASYTLTNLGQAPGVPGSYGGLTFLDANNLLVAGCSEDYTCGGAIYKVSVNRNSAGHIIGFGGTATLYSSAATNESGLSFQFGGLLFYTALPDSLGEIKTRSAAPDRTIDLSALGVCQYVGGQQFAPNGDLKATSFTCGGFYTLSPSTDGTNTFNVTAAALNASLKSSAGPEAFIYVPLGSPQFSSPSLLVTDWVSGTVSAWQVDSNYVPVGGTSQTLASIVHVFGAALDPVTHDVLVSTWDYGLGSVQIISGFAQPTWSGAIINTIAGNGSPIYGGDGGAATSSELRGPRSVALDGRGNIFIADFGNNRVRRIDATTGIIDTVAGNGNSGYSGDGGPATNASLNGPYGVAVDVFGNLFIADDSNNRIRRVDALTGTVSTIAGNGSLGFSGDGGPASGASFSNPTSVTLDGAGNAFVADFGNNRVRRIDATTGIIDTVAGNGNSGYSGDGSAATNASLNGPVGVVVDRSGNVFIADDLNMRIRRVDAVTGIITTVAGSGSAGYGGDGGDAATASLRNPQGVALDSAGNLFISDSANNRIRVINAVTGIINTIAGDGILGYSGDGGDAMTARFKSAAGIGMDAAGNLFIADVSNHRIRRIDVGTSNLAQSTSITSLISSQNPSTWNQPITLTANVSGQATATPTGNVTFQQGATVLGTVPLLSGQASQQATFTQAGMYSITVTYSGDSTYAPSTSVALNQAVTAQITTTISSSQNPSFAGELIQLTATVNTPDGGTATGTLAIYDGTDVLSNGPVSNNSVSIKIQSLSIGSHSITAVYSGDSKYLGNTSTVLTQIVNAGVTSADGNLTAIILPFGSVSVGNNASQSVLLSVNTSLTLTNIAANGDFTVTNDGCLLNTPLRGGTICNLTIQFTPTAAGRRSFQLTLHDANANAYKFGLEGVGLGATLAFTPGIISTVAGGGPGFVNGGLATDSSLNYPNGVTADAQGNLYIADYGNHVVRKVDSESGIITTLAGTGAPGYGADGAPATTAMLFNPRAVALDGAGNLFIADANNQRVRKVDAGTGYITTIAGTGTSGYNGDGEAATQASLTTPDGVTVDQNSNIFIADTYNNRIRKVDAVTGAISTVAGNGTSGFGGDGGPAINAILNTPADLTFDSAGSLYIADAFNQRIRRVDGATGNISTVAGSGVYGYDGDGEAAVNAALAGSYGIALDSAGNLYIADGDNSRVRMVMATTNIISTVAGNGVASYGGDGGAATSASLNAPHYVALDGLGNLYIADAQNGRIRKVNVTTSILSLNSVKVGQTGGAQVAVSNVGNAPLNFSQFSASANFALQIVGNDCSTSTPLPPGGTCNLGIVFAPTVAGNPLNGSLTITDNAPGSPHTVSLSGVGVGVPAISLSTLAIAFGNQTLNTTSPSQDFTITNTGTGDLSIATIAIAGLNAPDFSQTNNCPTALAAGGSCTISVAFTASINGPETASLVLSDNASGGPQTVSFTGTGFVPPPVLVSITINPSNPVVIAGSTLQLSATGNYSDGNTADLTSAVSWMSAQPTIASVGGTAGSQGLVMGVATGIDLISATYGVFSSSSTLTVNFASTGSLHLARSIHTATQLANGKVLIAGGVDSSGNPIAIAELYDPATGTFALTGSLSTPRQYHTATLLNNGKVLIAGGCSIYCGAVFASGELYDPATGTFTPTGNLNIARDIHTATLLSNGKVLIAGGFGGGGFGILASAELYDPLTGIFTATGNLNIAREWHVATALITGNVLITGGYQGGLQNAGELYDPSTGAFTLTGSMNVARDVHTATVLNSGQVLIAGGWGGDASDVTSAELYDPVSGTFAPTGSLNAARQQHTATLLSSGKVLIVGGSDTSGNYFASAEIYDPSSGMFSSTGNLNVARDPHTATLLSNGDVLIVGGANSSGSLASAELFVPDALEPPNLVSIVVTPASSTVDIGAAEQFTATGTFADTTTLALHSATWGVSDSTLATITNDATNRGIVFTLASGSTTVTACDGAICGSANLTVGMPKISLSANSVSFGSQTVGTTSASQTVVLNNTGNGTLNISSISLGGASSAEFTEATTCGATLVPASTCNIVISFAPSVTGMRNASITISDSATSSPQTISLSGTGTVAPTSTALVSSANPSVFNQPVTFTATITSSSGSPGGTVTFTDGANLLASSSVSGGSASLTVSALAVGSHSVMATYAGDASHGSSVSPALTQIVNKAATTTAIVSSKNPQQVGQTITFTATVASQFGGAAAGLIVFKSGTTTLGTVALGGNVANLTTSFSSAGTRSVTAQYAGDSNKLASTSVVLNQSVVAKFSTTTTLVSSLNPSFIGQTVTFTATVSSPGGTPPDGEPITFRRGSTALGTASLSGGTATFVTSTLPTSSNNITAVYAADTAFNGSTSAAVAQTVNKYNTSITFASNANPSIYGQSVTLTATVVSAGPAIPTGNAVFRNGGSNLATVALDLNGVATLTRTNLSVGTLSLTATYSGDTQSATNTASLSQVVNLVPTVTALVSSRNPSMFGQSVKFTATVTTSTGVTATGTVTFTSGATTLGTANLSGGKASLTTTSLPRGADAVTATYNGTANIAASSGSISQQVN